VYSLATRWCGFEPNDGEYKLMGLAPFGEPTYADQLAKIATIDDDGAIRVDARALRWWGGDPTRRRRLTRLLGPPRRPDEPIEQRHADLARSVQQLTERAFLKMAKRAKEVTGAHHLCLAGGVALNCAATGRLLREAEFDEVWVQPAAGDAGSAVGAALWYHHGELGRPRDLPGAEVHVSGVRDRMAAGGLGPAFPSDEIEDWLGGMSVTSTRIVDVGARCREVARRLADGAIVGWFEGRMEFGPRALGHRSILADPRSVTVQRDLNVRVKGRESFRPFAPAVLWERAHEWFDIDRPSPYMSFLCNVVDERRVATGPEPAAIMDRVAVVRSQIPACTHVDGTARVQTVHPEATPVFHRLLTEFEAITDCPILLNTSFNRAGEPIVCTPADALRSARSASLDLLVIEDHLIDLHAEATDATGATA
jgi:carbamoyltransferase